MVALKNIMKYSREDRGGKEMCTQEGKRNVHTGEQKPPSQTCLHWHLVDLNILWPTFYLLSYLFILLHHILQCIVLCSFN